MPELINCGNPHTLLEPMLVGRQIELEAIRSFVAATSGDAPVALMLEGDAGIGKTALWSAALTAAGGHAILCVSRPSEAETSFTFAALRDLLGERAEVLAQLPPPQRRALEVALLIRDAPDRPAEMNAVAAAALSTLRALAADGARVLVAIDDVQWLDASSAAALAYALRRVDPAERVRFLLARRPDRDSVDPTAAMLPERITRIALEPLSLGAIQRLISERLQYTPARSVAVRIHQVSGGNPFYALELAKALQAHRGGLDLSRELPVPKTLDALLGSRLDHLGPAATSALLMSALASDADEHLVLEATGDARGIGDALAAGLLVREGGRLRLAHPLFGSVVVGRTSPATVRLAHRRLADLAVEPEERARHLALATVPPDKDVAAALEAAARTADARGAAADAAQLAESAWRFTPADEETHRIRRLLDGAQRHWRIGSIGQPEEMLEHDLPLLPPGPERARALMLLAFRADEMASFRLLDEALADADTDTRASILAEKAFRRALGAVQNVSEARTWASEAVALAGTTSDGQLQIVCETTLLWMDALLGRSIAASAPAAQESAVPVFDHPERLLAVQAIWRGDVESARRRLEPLRDVAERDQEEWSQFVVNAHLVELEIRIGDFRAAEAVCERLRLFALPWRENEAGLRRFWAMLAAARGDRDGAQAQFDALQRLDGTARPPWQVIEARRALGFAALIAGDLDIAVRELTSVTERVAAGGIADPGAFPAAPDLIEALVLSGQLDRAAAELAHLEQISIEQAHPWGLAAAERCRGILCAAAGDEAAAADALTAAIASFRRIGLLLDGARAQLELGVLRRRARQRGEARVLLEEAAAAFDRLGCVPLAERAREEIGRLGGRRARPGLTATEARVAELVASGMSNAEVARALVVSTRSIEAHLTRIYAKLGIRSRTQLARHVLASAEGPAGGSEGR